jgi:ribonuclease P protein component
LKQFGLSKDERVRKKKDFELIFTKGKVVFSSNNLLKAVYRVSSEYQEPCVQIAAAVHKKAGKANWRNRIKRLLKESYRLNKSVLLSHCSEKKVFLQIVFSANQLNQRKLKKAALGDLLPEALDLMNKIKNAV